MTTDASKALQLETAFLSEVVAECRVKLGGSVVGYFSPTKKNSQVADFYRRNGFVAGAEVDHAWLLKPEAPAPIMPAWIDLRRD